MKLSTQAKVGLLVLLALVALSVIIIWKTDIFLLREGYEMTGTFNNIEGLTLGSEIRYRGFKVGKVIKIDPGPADIRITCIISGGIKFPLDSNLRVSYDGIVGMKYLEIKPGTSEVLYTSNDVLYGVRTAAIVDFVDIGSQNLQETKKILESIRAIIENPKIQAAFMDTVFTADRIAGDLEKLTVELRQTNKGIKDIVTDPVFQASVKSTVKETAQTLTSANNFFNSVGSLNLRATGGVDIGTRSNDVRGNIDIVQGENNYLRFGIGEGPTRQPGLLDILFTSKASDNFGYRLGVINNQLGGGLAYYPSRKTTFRGDIYDVNNVRPNWPKVRLGYEYEIRDYMDLMVTADDILNSNNQNFMLGVQVKPPGSRIY